MNVNAQTKAQHHVKDRIVFKEASLEQNERRVAQILPADHTWRRVKAPLIF